MFARTTLLALALAVPFTGCATDDAVDADDTAVVVDDDAMVDDAMMDDTMTDDAMMDDTMMDSDVTAQSTLDAANDAGGLTNIAPGAAVDNIDGWIAQLQGNPDFAPTVDGLQTLKTQLTTDPLDGAAIGQTLSMLGEQTTAAAGGDAGLEQLGSALSSAGAQLSGM